MLKLFSVDDHIIEPADVWSSRVPANLRDRAPHVVEEGGREFWVIDGVRSQTMGLNAVVGKPSSEWGMEPVRFSDMRPGCYQPAARAEDLRADGIVGTVGFPTLPGFGGRVFAQLPDRRLADACVRAYNDFVLDEWCPAAPDLFVPTFICQLWDVDAAVAEVRRAAARGARAVSFPENTFPMGLPPLQDPGWEPLWEALEAEEIVVSMHLGASGHIPMPSPQSNLSVAIAGAPVAAGSLTIVDLLYSEILTRHPSLKVVITEGGIGYVPYLLERADLVWEQHRAWAPFPATRPSELFDRHLWVCAVNEAFGLAQRDAIGVHKILWELDYPHSETTWPNSQRAAEKVFSGMPDWDVTAITHANAQAVFRFEGEA